MSEYARYAQQSVDIWISLCYTEYVGALLSLFYMQKTAEESTFAVFFLLVEKRIDFGF